MRDQSDTQIYNVVSCELRTKYFVVRTRSPFKGSVDNGLSDK